MAKRKKENARDKDRIYEIDLNTPLQDSYIALRNMSKRKDKTAYKKTVAMYRRQYNKMLSIARKRLERGLRSVEFGQDIVFQKAVYDPFKGLRDIKSNNIKSLMYEIGKVQNFLNSGTTIKERKDKRDSLITAFNENGYTFVNKRNYRNVVSFLNEYAQAVGSRMYDSERALSFYEDNAKKLNKMTSEDVYNAFKRYTESGEKP